ncbi:MAG: hypothetical protein R2850_11870 [Bacteroidia bacterium]
MLEAQELVTGFNIGEEGYFSSNGTRMVLFSTSSTYGLTNGFSIGAAQFVSDFNFQLEQNGVAGTTTYADDYTGSPTKVPFHFHKLNLQ